MDLIIQQGESSLALMDFEESLTSITKDSAIAALQAISSQESEEWFRIGMVLSAYKNSNSEESFKDLTTYAEKHFGINTRKAYYLISIHDALVASNISVEQVAKVGWTKLKEIAHLINTDNLDYWLDIATNNTTKQIVALLKSSATHNPEKAAALDAALDETPPDEAPAVVPELEAVESSSDTPLVGSVSDASYSPEVTYQNNFVAPTEHYDPLVTPSTATLEGAYQTVPNEGGSDDIDDFLEPDAEVTELVEKAPVEDVVMPNITLDKLVGDLAGYDLSSVISTLTDIYPHVKITVQETKDAEFHD